MAPLRRHCVTGEEALAGSSFRPLARPGAASHAALMSLKHSFRCSGHPLLGPKQRQALSFDPIPGLSPRSNALHHWREGRAERGLDFLSLLFRRMLPLSFPEGTVRLSIGLEAADDLIEDLSRALRASQKA